MIKVINHPLDETYKQKIINEIEIHKAASAHKHIVKFKGAYLNQKSQVCIEMERMGKTL